MEKAYYAVIPANVRYDEMLKDKAKLLYGEITALTNEKGFCWASNSYFAELYNVAKETISRLLRNLCERGYIKIEIVYKNREIVGRKIYVQTSIPIDKKINTYYQNNQEGLDEKINTPIDEKVKENNTDINNTINNTLDIHTISKDIVTCNKLQSKLQLIIDKWNELNLQKIVSINQGTSRYRMLNTRIKDYGENRVLEAIENIKHSSFLKGQNDRNWIITFDWLVKPNNFIKVLEGNYSDKQGNNKSSSIENQNNKIKTLKFNNFEPREYDYNDLENKLLGWDSDD